MEWQALAHTKSTNYGQKKTAATAAAAIGLIWLCVKRSMWSKNEERIADLKREKEKRKTRKKTFVHVHYVYSLSIPKSTTIKKQIHTSILLNILTENILNKSKQKHI